MTAGFILVTMEDVVLPSLVKFFRVDVWLLCLDLFQSMLTKIMFATAVLCSSDPVPSSVAVDDVAGNHADDLADDITSWEAKTRKQQLLEPIVLRKSRQV